MGVETKKKILMAIAAIGAGVIISGFTQLLSLSEEKIASKPETAVIKWEDIERINRVNITERAGRKITVEGTDIVITKE